MQIPLSKNRCQWLCHRQRSPIRIYISQNQSPTSPSKIYDLQIRQMHMYHTSHLLSAACYSNYIGQSIGQRGPGIIRDMSTSLLSLSQALKNHQKTGGHHQGKSGCCGKSIDIENSSSHLSPQLFSVYLLVTATGKHVYCCCCSFHKRTCRRTAGYRGYYWC